MRAEAESATWKVSINPKFDLNPYQQGKHQAIFRVTIIQWINSSIKSQQSSKQGWKSYKERLERRWNHNKRKKSRFMWRMLEFCNLRLFIITINTKRIISIGRNRPFITISYRLYTLKQLQWWIFINIIPSSCR